MNAYFDSGVLVKNYCLETNSTEAISLINAEPLPFPLTHLQEGEIRNALRLKLFRREVTLLALNESLRLLDADIHAGRLERPAYDAGEIYRRAEVLSRQYTSITGARMLDILHIAAALEIGSVRFVSFDLRQRSVAKRAGLKVLPKIMISS